MKKALIILISLLSLEASAQLPSIQNKSDIQVRFDHNIEFAGLIFFLGTMASDAATPGAVMPTGKLKKDWFAYDLSLAVRYKNFLNDPDLKTAASYLEKLQAPEIFPLLINVAPFPEARCHGKITYEMISGYAPGGDSSAAAREADLFLSALNRFYKTISFQDYYTTARPFYEKAIQEIGSALPARGTVAAMESFYGKRFAEYTLLPSLTIPSGMAFGVNTKNSGGIGIYNVFGPFAVQQFDSLRPVHLGYDDPRHILELSVHEFGHSFANPAVYALPDSLVRSKALLYAPIQKAMDDQGYTTWSSCLVEHFVRAGEVIIARRMGRTTAADTLLKQYVGERKFMYLPKIVAALEKLRADGVGYHDAVAKVAASL